MASLEVGVSALVRWNESKHVRGEVVRRSGVELPPSELRLLEFFDASEPMRISVVAECQHVDISTASLQLRGLRRERLVDAVRDASDGRATLITITDWGRDTVARVRVARRALLADLFADVPAADLERAAAVLAVVPEHLAAGLRDLLGNSPD